MSRGHGKLERSIIASLFNITFFGTAERGVQLLAKEYAGRGSPVTPSILSAVRRSLRALERKGKAGHFTYDGGNRWCIDNEYKLVAFHEAAHAVIARALEIPIKYATVKRSDGIAGHVKPGAIKESKTAIRKNILWTLAGRIAVTRAHQQKLIVLRKHGQVFASHGTGDDNKQVKEFIIELIGRKRKGKDGVWARAFEVSEYREKATREAEKLVRDNWDVILGVAADLAERETMTGDEIDQRIKFHTF